MAKALADVAPKTPRSRRLALTSRSSLDVTNEELQKEIRETAERIQRVCRTGSSWRFAKRSKLNPEPVLMPEGYLAEVSERLGRKPWHPVGLVAGWSGTTKQRPCGKLPGYGTAREWHRADCLGEQRVGVKLKWYVCQRSSRFWIVHPIIREAHLRAAHWLAGNTVGNRRV